jgi:uncharacterized protein (TIGR04222 family)
MDALNPFNLPGPAFLLFYLVLAAIVFFVLRQAIRWREFARAADAADLKLTDPFLIAYLRGGAAETITTAFVSLMDRGLLAADDEDRLSAKDRPDLFSMRPIERAVLQQYATPRRANDAYWEPAILAVCDEFRAKLEAQGLLAGATARTVRWLACLAAAALLVVVALTKIDIALARGHSNIGFLVFLLIASGILVFTQVKGRLTAGGDMVLADLKILFARLSAGPIRLNGRANEAAFATAVFGAGILPPDAFPFIVRTLPPAPPKPKKSDSWWNNSGCGSTSSCGSSCGGGGCGGGCGGCGG